MSIILTTIQRMNIHHKLLTSHLDTIHRIATISAENAIHQNLLVKNAIVSMNQNVRDAINAANLIVDANQKIDIVSLTENVNAKKKTVNVINERKLLQTNVVNALSSKYVLANRYFTIVCTNPHFQYL